MKANPVNDLTSSTSEIFFYQLKLFLRQINPTFRPESIVQLLGIAGSICNLLLAVYFISLLHVFKEKLPVQGRTRAKRVNT